MESVCPLLPVTLSVALGRPAPKAPTAGTGVTDRGGLREEGSPGTRGRRVSCDVPKAPPVAGADEVARSVSFSPAGQDAGPQAEGRWAGCAGELHHRTAVCAAGTGHLLLRFCFRSRRSRNLAALNHQQTEGCGLGGGEGLGVLIPNFKGLKSD